MSSESPDPTTAMTTADQQSRAVPLQSSGTSEEDPTSPTTTKNTPNRKQSLKDRDRERPKYTRLLQSQGRERPADCDYRWHGNERTPGKQYKTVGSAPLTLGPNAAKKQPFCKPCIASSLPCTYNFKAKKRGPASQHAKRLKATGPSNGTEEGKDSEIMDDYASRRDAAARSAMHMRQSTSSSLSPRNSLPSLPNMIPAPPHPHAPHSKESDWRSVASPHTQILPRLQQTDDASQRSAALQSPTAIFPPMMPPNGPQQQHLNHEISTLSPTTANAFSSMNLISPVGSSNTAYSSSVPHSILDGANKASPSDDAMSGSSPYTTAMYSPQSHYSGSATLSTDQHGQLAQQQLHQHLTHAGPSGLSTFHRVGDSGNNGLPGSKPTPRSTKSWSLTNLAPTPTILHVLSLFFDFVWPLTPCIHRPSFYADLGEKREERDPLFFALVCSTISSTLVQVPLSYLPMDRKEVRRLARSFATASRRAAETARDPPSSMMVIIRYFDNIYHFREGKDGSSNAAVGEAVYISAVLRMHQEEGYEGLDHIESEVRRRAFYLLYGADKSIASLNNRPCMLRDEDCTVQLPTEVDDEFITARAILPQPPNKTPIISGFIYISQIWKLVGEMLPMVRRDRWKPPSGQAAIARLEEVCEMHTKIIKVFDQAPHELRLKSTGSLRRRTSSASSPKAGGSATPYDFFSGGAEFDGVGFAQGAIAEVNQLFENPDANKEDAGNAFLVMQANIHVTQHVARLQAEQHRQWLVTLIRDSGVHVHSPIAAAEIARGGWTRDDREAVAKDLLHVLHSIPILSITTNGPSLVHKVRFVASTLLDAIREADTAPTPAARALTYLWDFLAILSEIEKNYSLNDEIDPPPPTQENEDQ
ncbi:hypothetical protein FRB96_009511 [Tulasnella sp. 330]|nr:hypothetical protein FRB96_009511 [Tulasnella sp. 330]